MPASSHSPVSASSSAAHLRADGISLTFGSRRVLTDVSFTVATGERAGLIGENGSGKSTLLRILAGLLTPDVGTVHATAPGGRTPRIGLLHQEPPFADTVTVAQALESAVAPIRQAAHAIDETAAALAEDPEDETVLRAYADALETAEHLRVWDVDARIDALLDGLGLDALPRDRSVSALSGGQRSRLSLAWLLLSGPDVLLLDEPTNHLDDAATQNLRGVLTAWPGPVLLASHDRAFLDETVTTLLDLDPAPAPHAATNDLIADGPGSGIGLTRFSGTYTDYLQTREDARERWERQFRDEQAELTRLRAAVGAQQSVGHDDWTPRTESRIARKFYADRNATVVSRRVNDARNRLAELEERQVRKPPRELRFQGLGPAVPPQSSVSVHPNRAGSGVSSTVLTASGAEVEGRLAATDLTVRAGEKWLVTGPNGAGKSTLLHLLAGDLSPTNGSVHAAGGVRIGLLTQDIRLPDPHDRGPERTVARAYEDLVGTERAEAVSLTATGLLAGRDLSRPVGVLSVGQQRRLELAVLLADPPDVLLLDEPTNHLSLLLVTQLEAALRAHDGTVVVASHDRWLRRGWTGPVLHVSGDPAA